MTTIASLPCEITSQVLFYLPLIELPLLRRVCKLWNQVIDHPIFINAVCRPHFGKLPKVLDKAIWKKFHASYQWLSSKSPRVQLTERLPIENVCSFAKCKEGLIIAGMKGRFFKLNDAQDWKQQNFINSFEAINLDVHRDGYFYSYYLKGQSRYSQLYFQKWKSNFADSLIDGLHTPSVRCFKVFEDDLFMSADRITPDFTGRTVAIERWDFNRERLSDLFSPNNKNYHYTCLSCNETYLAAAKSSNHFWSEASISLWDVRKPNAVINNFGEHNSGPIKKIDLKDSYLLESRHSEIRFWDLRYLKLSMKKWDTPISDFFIHIDSAAFLIGAADTGIVEFWNISDLQKKQEWQLCPKLHMGSSASPPLMGIQWEGNRLDALVHRSVSNTSVAMLETYIV